MPDGNWTMPTSNPNYCLDALQLALQIAGLPYHNRSTGAKGVLVSETDDIRFFSGGGIYYKNPPVYTVDGQAVPLSFTNDGLLRTNASFSGTLTVNVAPITWISNYYEELTVTDGPAAVVSFGFAAKQLIISNDDVANSVWISYNADPVTVDSTHMRIGPGETFEDQIPANNVNLLCDTGKTASVRIWARSDV